MRHQSAALEKLDRLKVGALFMEMGTGKGRTFMELARRKMQAGKAARAVLLCPVSARDHLAEDILKHTGEVATIHCDGYTLSGSRFNIIGIESLSTSVSAFNKLMELSKESVMVIDESQLIKNKDAARTRHIIEASRGSRYRYISSGLPMPNGVEDLWSQMNWLSPFILSYKSYNEFSRHHLRHSMDEPGHYGRGRVVGRFNTDVIASKIAPYTFEIRKSDCLDLPEKTYSYRSGELSDAAKLLYKDAKRRLLYGKKAFEVDDATIYKMFSALQLISSGVVPQWLYRDGEKVPPAPENVKIPLLMQVLESAKGKKVIWCKYRAEADAAQQAIQLAGMSCARIDGKIPLKERKKSIQSFREDVDILISTLQVGGMAHDWGFADYAIYMSNSFDYMLRAQSEDRTHRAMMTGKAHYIDLRVDTGIEKKIHRSLNMKENAVKSFQNKIRELRADGTKHARDIITQEIEEL